MHLGALGQGVRVVAVPRLNAALACRAVKRALVAVAARRYAECDLAEELLSVAERDEVDSYTPLLQYQKLRYRYR